MYVQNVSEEDSFGKYDDEDRVEQDEDALRDFAASFRDRSCFNGPKEKKSHNNVLDPIRNSVIGHSPKVLPKTARLDKTVYESESSSVHEKEKIVVQVPA
jgi:hypothetical protein